MASLPVPHDAANDGIWGEQLVAAIESLHQTGTHAARPTTDLVEGTLYACSTHGVLERWDGAAWVDYVAGALAPIPQSRTTVARMAIGPTTNGTWNAIAFDTETIDELGAWVSGQATRLTAPTTGLYLIASSLAYSSSGPTYVQLAVNGARIPGREAVPIGSTQAATFTRMVYLNAGDYVELFAYGSTSFQTIAALSDDNTTVTMTRLGASSATTVASVDGLVLNGGLTLLKKVTLSAAAATIDLTAADLPEGYDALMIDVMGRGDTAANEVGVQLILNGDTTAANYQTKFQYSSPAASDNTSSASIPLTGFFPGATATANAPGMSRTVIPSYDQTAFHKVIQSEFSMETAGGTYNGKIGARWANTAKVTSLTVKTNGGNFAAGTTVAVYGVGGPGSMKTGVDPTETWKDYTPTLTSDGTNPNLGTGAITVGRYTHVGNTVKVRGYIKWGTTGASSGTGTYAVSLPKPPKASDPIAASFGSAWTYVPAVGVDTWTAVFTSSGALAGKVRFFKPALSAFAMSATSPNWAQSSEFGFEFTYETDEYKPVVVPVAGSTTSKARSVLSSDFTTSVASAWNSVPGLTTTFTPQADGFLLPMGRARVSVNNASDVYVRSTISPAPEEGDASKQSAYWVNSAQFETFAFPGWWRVKAGVTYTVTVEAWHSVSGTLTISSAVGYTEQNLLFIPTAVGIASSDQIPQLLASKELPNSAAYNLVAGGATDTDIDATNAAITFVAPASGKVTVRLSGLTNSDGPTFNWTLREGATTVAASTMGSTGYSRRSTLFTISGLVPGSTHTYKWGSQKVGATAGTVTMWTGGNAGSSGNAVMEVWDAQPVPISGTIPWIDLTLDTGWSSQGGTFGRRPQYRRVGDRVEVRGTIKKTDGTAMAISVAKIANFPAGYRPVASAGDAAAADPTISVEYWSNGGSSQSLARMEVAPNGDLKFAPGYITGSSTTGPTWVSISGSFSVQV